MGAARIGKIRMKAGGAEVRVLRRDLPNNQGTENYSGKIIECARNIAGYGQPGSELTGFVVLGLYADGATSIGWRYDATASVVPRAMLPGWVSEVLRRDIITHVEAAETYNRANGFDPE